jgi:alkaline phosphatase
MLEDAYFVSAGKITKDHEEEYEMYGGYHPMAVTATKILNNRAGMSFTTWSHTATPVPVFVIGAGAALFDGFYDNTDIPKKIAQAMKIDFNK